MGPIRPVRPVLRVAVAAVLAAILCSGAVSPQTPAAAPSAGPSGAPKGSAGLPNLLLITVDGLRPDRLSCYRGKEAVPTPAIDALAAEGRLFEQVLTPSPSSLPALAGLLTGQTPFRHQVWDDSFRNRLPAEALTLAERLKKEGYRTAAFLATSRLAAGRGMDQGFDLYQDGYSVPANGVWRLSQRPGSKLIPAAKSWLEGGNGPFFLWLHFIETVVPTPMPQTTSIAAAEAASYAKRVALVDSQVGEIVAALKERGLYDRTVAVLTATHGMALGEHGEWRSGIFLYEGTVRVPLLIRTLPGDPKRGSRSSDLAGLVDLFPTLERLLKIAPTPGLPGRDLLGPTPATAPAYHVVALMGREVFGWVPREMVASGTRRLISGASVELFDVGSDPGQEKNLGSGASPEVRALQEIRKRLTGGAPLPPPHFLPARGLSEGISKRLVEGGYAAPTPANARKRTLPDPRPGPSSMRILEMASAIEEVKGYSALGEVKETLLKEDPEGLFTLVNIPMAVATRGDGGPEGLASAQALLRKGQGLFPLESQIYHALVHTAFAAGKYADAELFSKAALELSPRFPAEIRYDLACVYARQGKKEQALAELRGAIRLGFRDSAHIAADPDLEGLRQDPSYKRLIQEEFPTASGG